MAAATSGSCREIVLSWGGGPSQAGLEPGGPEHLARGPQAVAVAPDGTTLVLDQVNRRVLAIDASGAVRIAVTGVAPDAEDLAAGADGALAVYSPLQSRAWLFEPSGAAAGTVAIDRALHDTIGIALGPSRQVLVRSAYQETMTAGSPAAPTALPTMLAGKREGAFLLAGELGISTRAAATGTQLVVTANHDGRRATTRAVFAIPGASDAALPFGAAGELACVRTEQLADEGHVAVTRRAVCVNALTGTVRMDRPMAARGIYVPAHELAIGGSTPRVASIEPERDRIVIRSCEVSR